MGTQRLVGCRVGDITKTTAKMVVCSLTNAASTYSCSNGQSGSITWLPIGQEGAPGGSQAGFYAHIALTGLTAFTAYTWTVGQASWSNSGSFRSAANATDDFTLFWYGCVLNLGTTDQPGFYDYIRTYQQSGALPVQALIMHDDITYMNYGGSEYGAANNWFKWFAIEATAPGNWGTAQSALENSAFMPQWGDHEFANDVRPAQVGFAVPNGYHKTAPVTSEYTTSTSGYDGCNLVVYNLLVAPLQGTAVSIKSRDLLANHWAADFGCVRYIPMDSVTRDASWPNWANTHVYSVNDKVTSAGKTWVCSTGHTGSTVNRPNEGTGSWQTYWTEGTPVDRFGTRQIDDVLDCANVRSPVFKIISITPELRWTTNPAYCNKESETLPASEVERLCFSNSGSPASICANPLTAGGAGSAFITHGDNHSANWAHHGKAATGSAVAEDLFVCGSSPGKGTWFGGPSDPAQVGTRVDGILVPISMGTASTRSEGLQIDVYGSRGTIRVRRMYATSSTAAPGGYTWTVLGERWFSAYNSGLGAATEAELKQKTNMTLSSSL